MFSTAPPESPGTVRPLQLDAWLPFPVASLSSGSGPCLLLPLSGRKGVCPPTGRSPGGLAWCPVPPGPPLPVASRPPQGPHAVGNELQQQAHGPEALPVLPGLSPEGLSRSHCEAICPPCSKAREKMKAVRLKHNRGSSRESRKWGRGPRAGSPTAIGAGAHTSEIRRIHIWHKGVTTAACDCKRPGKTSLGGHRWSQDLIIELSSRREAAEPSMSGWWGRDGP